MKAKLYRIYLHLIVAGTSGLIWILNAIRKPAKWVMSLLWRS